MKKWNCVATARGAVLHRYESIVEMVSVVSSSTSSSTRTVSREVKIVTLFSVESWRIFTPSLASDVEPMSLVLMT